MPRINENVKSLLSIIIPLFIVLIIFAGAVSVGIITIGEQSIKKSEVSVSLVIDYGNGDIDYYDVTTINSTVYGCLLEAAYMGNFSVKTTYYGNFDSLLVDEINNVINGENEKYWQYYLNNEYPSIGADKLVVENGDLVEWKFEGFDF